MNQQQHDLRSLQWHRLVISRMREDDRLLEKAKETLKHWLSLGPKPNRFYLAEWEKAINGGLDQLELLATKDNEHGCNLRQCSPISGVLTNKERWAFRRQWEINNEPSKS